MPAPPLSAMSGSGALTPTDYAVGMMESLFGRQFGAYQSAQSLSAYMQRAGGGARGIIHAIRPNGPGHYLNVVNYKGNVMLLDGQLGGVVNWSELTNNFGLTQFSLMRTQ